MKTKWMFLSQDAAGGGKVANEEIFRIIRLRFSDISVRSYLPTLPKLSSPFPWTKQLLWSFFHWHRYLKRFDLKKFDAIITTSIPALVVLYWIRQKPDSIVYLFHGEQLSVPPPKTCSDDGLVSILRSLYSRFFYRFFMKQVNRHALRRVDKIITFSNWAARYVQRTYGINPKHITVIPHGVDHAFFHPLPASLREELRRQMRITAQQRVVFYLGRIDPYRGVHYLIDAITLLQSCDSHIVLILASLTEGADSAYVMKMRTYANAALGRRAIFLSHVAHSKKLAGFYAISDCVIRPSLPGTEVGPLVLLEALACGVPFIGTRAGNIPELLEPIDERLILKDNKPQTIARSLQYLFSLNPRELAKIKQRGIDIAANYSWEKTARELALLISRNRARESFCDDVVMG